jgi:hypothetical protein
MKPRKGRAFPQPRKGRSFPQPLLPAASLS